MQTPNTRSVAGLILAGGRGERLGGAMKSELLVGGVRLIDRVAASLAACTPILVAHGRLDAGAMGLSATMHPVPDPHADIAGPLAGLAGAMAYLRTLPNPPEFIVSVAVDTPFLPPDYVDRLVLAIGNADAAIASSGGQPYPTNAIWRVRVLLALADRIADGTGPRSLKGLAASSTAIDVPWDKPASGDPFANINTPADLVAAEARANGIGTRPA